MEPNVAKTPVHLWLVGVLSLLWNSFGAYDYFMTRTRNTDYLSSMPGLTAEQILAYVDSFPLWAQAAWGFGVWGALLGSILLLMRNRWAVTAFAVSLAGAIISFAYQYAGPPAPAPMNEGAMAIMPIVIIAVAALLYFYAYRQRASGVLRSPSA
jgi:hypothetical protein